ncbi:MscS Mechanosensitive ion channel [Thermogladius calderae 1633]|uniref:MscS Mechanosensitive ion channel n=1 Tax=Thermogladius calderae (strain DSM 22663 / VKM B-2946 / 1633) TaxID=1184251 RepID=I3TCT6_THEC1|nr:mechanosensitive ion channel family protein [Thermogladius calderae]AFK50574.1 MscS Mechanosensitive ion channel [Thermogladius calderae 1633]
MGDLRRLVYLLLLIIVVGILAWAIRQPGILPDEIRVVVVNYYPIIQVTLALILGVSSIELVSSMILTRVKHIGREAYLIRNVVLIIGYVVLGVVILALLGVSGESILAGATFSGLVIGLGLQPVLANLFAGLIILGSGFIKPGSRVRIGSPGLPVSAVTFPAYKAFSLDYIVPSLKGVVVEVGLMYTKVVLDSGELVKIPNSTLFSGSIVLEEVEEEKRFQVRFEFPVDCDPYQVLESVRRVLSELGEFKVLVEEQSDKNYYIVLVTGNTPPKAKLREFRSEVLAKLIQVYREMRKKGLCGQQ